MGLIHQEVGVVRPAHLDDIGERRDVASNRIEALDDDQPVLLTLRQARQLLPQALGGIVPKSDDLRRGLARRVVDARVAVGVDQMMSPTPHSPPISARFAW
jgi:hypothetical protein